MSLEEAVETDRHFGFSALPSVTAPHDWNILNHKKRILFVRDRIKSPVHISYIARKKLPALNKLNEAIAYASNGYPTIHNRYMQPYDQYIIKHLQENVNVLILSHITVLFAWTGKLLLFAIAYLFGEIVYFRYNHLFTRCRRNVYRFGTRLQTEETSNNIELTHFSHFEQ
ncbi:unnamed protein product [Cylicocyclus nassatus]|uniref:Uncharacterized protein n=1 Tax=Cylicocyclus nassatus TaxID=53992 RepID=A0AA36HCF9_CYLNA|nr:unnamed protein product [Cylicocyclus nassatus]